MAAELIAVETISAALPVVNASYSIEPAVVQIVAIVIAAQHYCHSFHSTNQSLFLTTLKGKASMHLINSIEYIFKTSQKIYLVVAVDWFAVEISVVDSVVMIAAVETVGLKADVVK